VLLIFLIATYRRLRLSNFSYALIFAFMCLHVIGAHYTYSNVPLEDWSATVARWFGVQNFDVQAAFGLTRNHYDRFVHLMFGLLLTYPLRELIVHIARLRGGWSYTLPLAIMLSFSTAYELIEWGIAMVFAPDVGQAYLGTQGDEWDPQKDMALAALGSTVTSLIIALAHCGRKSKRVSAADSAR
jgi:putative membrane protein